MSRRHGINASTLRGSLANPHRLVVALEALDYLVMNGVSRKDHRVRYGKKDRLERPALRRTKHSHDDDYCQRTHHARTGEWEHTQQQMGQISRHG